MLDKVLIEVFTASGCSRCQAAIDLAESARQHFTSKRVEWLQLNVVEHLDYAVQLKLLHSPALVINKQKVFTRTPDKETFFSAIEVYLKAEI